MGIIKQDLPLRLMGGLNEGIYVKNLSQSLYSNFPGVINNATIN